MVLPYKPATAGVHRLAVWVDPVAGERSTVDNRQEFQGLAIDPGIKVLYLEGRLRDEYRELKHLLEHDPNIELATLLRVKPTGDAVPRLRHGGPPAAAAAGAGDGRGVEEVRRG